MNDTEKVAFYRETLEKIVRLEADPRQAKAKLREATQLALRALRRK